MDNRWTQEQIFFDDINKNKEYGVGYKIKKSKIKKRKKFNFFIFCCVIFFVGIAYFTINIYSSLTYNVSAESNICEQNYYAVSITKGKSYELYSNIASQIQTLGGAGYLFFKDDIYYVLASIYSSEQEAQVVKNKLIEAKYDKCEILTFTTKEFKGVSYYQKIFNYSKKDINKLFDYIKTSIKLLFDISINYDKKTINFNAAKEQIVNLYSSYSQKANDFILYAKDMQKSSDFVNIVETINKELQKRSNDLSQESSFSYQIKYSLINIILTLT